MTTVVLAGIWVGCGIVVGIEYYVERRKEIAATYGDEPEAFAERIGAFVGALICVALGPIALFLRCLR